MTIFDALRFPFNTVEDARNDYQYLPIEIQVEFDTWWDKCEFAPTQDEQLAFLRKQIKEYEAPL